MSRDKQVTFYVSQRKKDRLQREADEADVTVSTLLDSILDQHWADADTDEASERMDAEEKIERVANQALQEIEATARHTEQRVDDLAEIVARSGSYSVANFELLKYQHGPPEGTKTDALRVGSRRLRAPFSDHPDCLIPTTTSMKNSTACQSSRSRTRTATCLKASFPSGCDAAVADHYLILLLGSISPPASLSSLCSITTPIPEHSRGLLFLLASSSQVTMLMTNTEYENRNEGPRNRIDALFGTDQRVTCDPVSAAS